MDNVVLAMFHDKEKAIQAFDTIQAEMKNVPYTVHDMAIMTKRDGIVAVLDGYSIGIDSKDDTIKGGLLGAVVGLMGGPLGLLIGAAVGVGAGAIIDNTNIDEEDAMLFRVSALLEEHQYAVAAYITESDENDFNENFASDGAVIYRFAAEDVAAEINSAQLLQNEIANRAREELAVATRPLSPLTIA